MLGDKVNVYACGVTVYDHCHIGHARSLYVFEVMRRYLKHKGYDVKFVRNITDVDDKIINKARLWAKERGISLIEAFGQVRTTYIDSYYSDLHRLGIAKADHEPQATENIEEMIAYIKTLIDKDFAYESGGSVYFAVRKLASYGCLSGKKVDDLLESVRIENDPNKRDPLDFALWKQAKDDEPSWPSPWGNGRPGWHIECSVMSQKYLAVDTLDIHGGGLDLVFPHHENECAQSQAYSAQPLARFWIHHGLLTINKHKMAKSLGNFVTIADVLDKYPADILKLFYSQAHYSSAIDFSWDKIEEAKKAYERVMILLDKIDRKLGECDRAASGENFPDIELAKSNFIDAMNDDFNMPQALAGIFDFITITNKNIEDIDFLLAAKQFLKEHLSILAINPEDNNIAAGAGDEIEKLISQREAARRQKNYAQADVIRKQLDERGIILEDTKDGAIWRRKI